MPDEYRQLKRLKNATGKTVERIVDVDTEEKWIVILFTDGSYLPIEAVVPYDEDVDATLCYDEFDPVRKVAAGVGNPEDFKFLADLEARNKSADASREKEQYLRLKRKFEFDEEAGRWKT